jgi:hypothetical protein
MKKEKFKQNSFDTPYSRNISFKSNEIKTTNINILLNRVRINKKKKFKKKILFLLVVLLFITIVSFFY